MAVMENIRLGANNPWMKALFAVIVLVFVFWGIGANGPTNQEIAFVNGERITDTQYQRLMRVRARDLDGGGTDEEQKRMAQQVVQELIQTKVLLQEARSAQITVSSEEIARFVLQYDAFKDSDGNFSQKLYKRNLKRMGLTQGKFEDQIRDDLAIRKLFAAVANGIKISDGQVRRQYLQESTKVSLKVLRIPDASLLDDVEVDDDALDAFVSANEADIRSRYEADYRRLYRKPRRATISQILLRTDLEGEREDPRGRLQKVLKKARDGEDFAKLARIHSEDINARHGGVMGTVAEEQLEKTVAEAVFATETGGITDVLPVKNGLLIVKVDAVFPSEETAFDDVKTAIGRTLTQERSVGPVAAAYASEVLADWKTTGAPSAEKLLAQKLTAQDTGEFAIGRPAFPGLSDSPVLMNKLASTTGVGLIDTVFAVPGGRMIVEVTSFERPDEETMKSEEGLIRKRLEFSAQRQFVQVWTEDLVARADIDQRWRP